MSTVVNETTITLLGDGCNHEEQPKAGHEAQSTTRVGWQWRAAVANSAPHVFAGLEK